MLGGLPVTGTDNTLGYEKEMLNNDGSDTVALLDLDGNLVATNADNDSQNSASEEPPSEKDSQDDC
ncbi:hypothetical protein SAMN05421858_4545 [Haladaptatus litoreus]|uniref:Uncharacterized protein n=1 Tax=Haladaptatus litoreus TaxID=553468 RepID=A0A1N7EVX7_9EURY|nr:hypothetical protein [Haladaptatus litoreus]SIR92197.1 hypothetical protein SAMN05421858_4545 [Haladaptatus litoreus]